MPSGKIHLRLEIGILVLLASAAAAMIFLGKVEWGMVKKPLLCFAGAYLFSTLFLSPDMDLSRSDSQNRWGVFRVFWIPYAAVFSHRGVSHNPLFGPLSRIVYLSATVFAVWSGLHYGLSVDIVGIRDMVEWWKKVFNDPWLWATLAGLLLPNEIHILADGLFKN
jgi:uncharacterized metal-binding protein